MATTKIKLSFQGQVCLDYISLDGNHLLLVNSTVTNRLTKQQGRRP